MIAQVLHRLHLAKVIRSGNSGSGNPNLDLREARDIAAEMELSEPPDLEFFSFKILLLGKTGVGKSATINSIFNQKKVETSAFEPATSEIREITDTVKGIKITVIDTPGLRPSQNNQRHNRRLMTSIKRFIKKSPPDVILYVDRVDFCGADFLILKLVSDIMGSSIWFNAVMVFTHSSESPESSLSRCSNSIQSCINRAIADTRFEVPVLSVENDPCSWYNNSPPWLSELLLLCGSMKVLSEANAMLRFQNSIKVGRRGKRTLSLPHLLSSLLQWRSMSVPDDLDDLDSGDDDDGDLPPFRVLSRAQFEKLSKSQKKAYLEELDYRETVLLKRQLREDRQRHHPGVAEEVEEPEAADSPPVDMALPESFDQDCFTPRYRFLARDEHWVVRPVLDSHGWDHDVGFDGVNAEVSGIDFCDGAVKTFLSGQVSKDKKDCNLVAEGGSKWAVLEWCDVAGGFDLQAAGKESVLTLKAAAAAKARKNSAACGVSLTGSPLTGEVQALGVKVEDSVVVGRRIRVSFNGGVINGRKGQAACGGGMELTLLGKDFPVRQDEVTAGLTLLSFDQELVMGSSLKSEFRFGRGTRMGVDVSVNSRQMGRLSIKTTTSVRNLAVVVFVVFPLIRSLLWRRLVGRRKNREGEGEEP